MTRLLLPLMLLIAACSAPTEKDLEGIWVNLDRGTLRVFEFGTDFSDVDGTPAYHLYLYASGTTAELVQSGTYSTENTPLGSANDQVRYALVTNVQSSTDPAQEGESYGNEFREWETDLSMTLDSPSGPNGIRVYTWSEIIP